MLLALAETTVWNDELFVGRTHCRFPAGSREHASPPISEADVATPLVTAAQLNRLDGKPIAAKLGKIEQAGAAITPVVLVTAD